MNRATSREVWEMHVWKWQQSDLTIAEYCRKNQLRSASFYKWRATFSAEDQKIPKQKDLSDVKSEFVQVKIADPTRKSSQESIKLSFTSQNGDALIIESKDAELVMKICDLLRAR